jgi:hypothetical protein
MNRQRHVQLTLVIAASASLSCGGKLADPAGPQRWAAGRPVFVDVHKIVVSDNVAPNIVAGVSGHLESDLEKMGMSIAPFPRPDIPLIKLEFVGRNDIRASLLLKEQSLENYDINVDECTSMWWGDPGVADRNMACLARGLSVRIGQSSELKRIYAEQAGMAPERTAVAALPPTPAPAAAVAAGHVSASPQPTAYAVVIGVERYMSGLTPPTGARSDAKHMAEMLRTSLGIPQAHMQVVLDEAATKGAIERALAWARASTPAGGRIYFYFSGHGAPDAGSGASYIVPSDGDPQYLDATAIPMREVLEKLSQAKAREVVAMVDACFSGAGGRSVLPPGARPLMTVRTDTSTAPAQVALFSASGANEISGPAPGDGAGGLFTTYLLDALGTGAADINGDGQISLGELQQWVSPRVARVAQTSNRTQNPALIVGRDLGSAEGVILEWGLPSK